MLCSSASESVPAARLWTCRRLMGSTSPVPIPLGTVPRSASVGPTPYAALVAGVPRSSCCGGAPTVEVSMSDEFTFEPDEITVASGETVRLVVTNTGESVQSS